MIYIHEIDNDGRGANTWEVSKEGVLVGSHESFITAATQAIVLAKINETTVTIYTTEWYYKQHKEEQCLTQQ